MSTISQRLKKAGYLISVESIQLGLKTEDILGRSTSLRFSDWLFGAEAYCSRTGRIGRGSIVQATNGDLISIRFPTLVQVEPINSMHSSMIPRTRNGVGVSIELRAILR